MGRKFHVWNRLTPNQPQNYQDLLDLILLNRGYSQVEKLLYGDYGLFEAFTAVKNAIQSNKRIALYADYDVDGTMSCVSWIWFFKGIGFTNYVHYIPDRMSEGYGVNLKAVQTLARDEKADLIITMDTGITANEEAAWCKAHGIEFICTDHHKIQKEKMPDCIILNPKAHPDPLYQELCGCGVTFVLLRKLAEFFPISPQLWNDILALTGMATICDVVPLNGVNHRLAQMGVQALLKSKRPVFLSLLEAATVLSKDLDERDIGFRLGPRINAVGRLSHAKEIIKAFTTELQGDIDSLVTFMGECNEERKSIQSEIVQEARALAQLDPNSPVLFLGGNWHHGVVGIAASKIAEEFWRPTWLFHRSDSLCRGSARSIPGFDVTQAMSEVSPGLFKKFGGHTAAGGFSFETSKEAEIREGLSRYAESLRLQTPSLWKSRTDFDFHLPWELANLELCDHLKTLRPFGHAFREPLFSVEGEIQNVRFFYNKATGEPKHTTVNVRRKFGEIQKIIFFNEVHHELTTAKSARFLVTASKETWQGKSSLNFIGADYEL